MEVALIGLPDDGGNLNDSRRKEQYVSVGVTYNQNGLTAVALTALTQPEVRSFQLNSAGQDAPSLRLCAVMPAIAQWIRLACGGAADPVLCMLDDFGAALLRRSLIDYAGGDPFANPTSELLYPLLSKQMQSAFANRSPGVDAWSIARNQVRELRAHVGTLRTGR